MRRAARLLAAAVLGATAAVLAAPPAGADPPPGCQYHSNQTATVNRFPLRNTVGFGYCTAVVDGVEALFNQTTWCTGAVEPYVQIFIEFNSCNQQLITGDGAPFLEVRVTYSYDVKIGWRSFTIGNVGCMEHWRLLPRGIPEHLPDSGCPAG
ncbi:MAG TPA: hypothetical protein VIL36_11855 [Acidimicrobiales bacterium]